MSVSLAFLVEPDNYTLSRLFYLCLSRRHLLAAVAFDTVKNMRPDAVRMDTAQNVLAAGNVAHDERDSFLLTVVIEDLGIGSVFCSQFSFGKSGNHTLNSDTFALDELPVAGIPRR